MCSVVAGLVESVTEQLISLHTKLTVDSLAKSSNRKKVLVINIAYFLFVCIYFS